MGLLLVLSALRLKTRKCIRRNTPSHNKQHKASADDDDKEGGDVVCGGSGNVEALPPGLDEVVPGFGNGAAGGPVNVDEPPPGPPADVGPAVDVGGDAPPQIAPPQIAPPPIAQGHARQVAAAVRDDVPPGCSLHRYEGSARKNPYWFATLPAEMVDDLGRTTRCRTFAARVRSEEDAVADCHA